MFYSLNSLRHFFSINNGIFALFIVILIKVEPSSAEEKSFSPNQTEQINHLIKQYILEHPQVILESMERMQDRQKAENEARIRSAIRKNKQELEADLNAPVIGNSRASITVVEFFDYRCGYCKKVFNDMMIVLREKPNIRFVLKEFPILGAESVAASRASLAIWRTHKNKYQAFHSALLGIRGGISKEKIFRIAQKLGIRTNELERAIKDPEIDKILENNRHLATALNINGTPVFIIGDRLIAGAISLDAMRKVIAAAGG